MKFCEPEWQEELTSTNTVLAQRVREQDDALHGCVLAARVQTAGRGRHSRSWTAMPGRDLTFSFAYTDASPADFRVSLPMAAALGVAEFLEQAALQARVKWPNDVLVDGRKICGILAEGVGSRLIVGIGLNVNMRADEAGRIDRPATSMHIETGKDFDVANILQDLLPYLSRRIADWEGQGFAGLKAAWEARCHNLGRAIEVGEDVERQAGVLVGFGPLGQLCLQRDDGQIVEVWAGDVSF